MRRYALSTLLFLILFCLVAPMVIAATPGKLTGGIKSEFPDWFKDSFLEIASDSEEASAEGKHLMLFMHLNNCPYCYKMLEENFKNAPYTQFIKDNFDVIQVNIKGDREVAFDENTSVTEKELAKLLKVSYTPTILFLNGDNQTVLRLNGYRSSKAFEHALHYVKEQAYQRTTLNRYIEEVQPVAVYKFRDHPEYQNLKDLQAIPDKPLAVVLEDRFCDACDALYDGHFSNPETNDLLKLFTVVRLDALSDDPLVDPQGKQTTIREFVEDLGISYRPGIVMFDKGKEIMRIDTLLYTFHFQEALRFVGGRHYPNYPRGYHQFTGKRSEEILKSGRNIDLSK